VIGCKSLSGVLEENESEILNYMDELFIDYKSLFGYSKFEN